MTVGAGASNESDSDARNTVSLASEATRRMRRQRRRNRLVSVAVLLCIAGLWQVLSYLDPGRSAAAGGSPLIPGWGWLATRAFPAIANYGTVGSLPTRGSYSGAISVLAHDSLVTWLRLLAGVLCGGVAGIGIAVAVSWSRLGRMLMRLPAHILRTFPLLAMIPLFELWFGVSFVGIVLFVSFGIGVIVFAGTVNAISNVAPIYLDNARTLGASGFRVYRSVVLPAAFPEIRTSIVLSLGAAWSAVVGAEFLGAQSGLGFIEAQADEYALLDRMIVVALLFLVYAALSYLAFETVTRPFLQWQRSAVLR